MKTIAIGFGLPLAFLALLDFTGAAAGLPDLGARDGAESRTSSLDDDPNRSVPEATAASRLGRACDDGPDAVWFTALHPLDEVVGQGCFVRREQPYLNDVNGDGVNEALIRGSHDVVEAGIASTHCALAVQEVHLSNGATVVIESCVLRADRIAEPVLARFPGAWRVNAYLFECLRDMDQDGDLDIVLYCSASREDGTSLGTVDYWLENTGYSRSSITAADLNRDGRIDGADMGLLLMAWGSTP